MNTDSQWSKQEACSVHATRVWLTVNHNISVTSEFDVRSVLHWQVSLAICVFHDAMNGCNTLKIH